MLSGFKQLTSAAFASSVYLIGSAGWVGATDFTAGVVMDKMTSEQRFSFVSGVVEGLAYARYVRDGKQTEGMRCIYKWFYEEPKAVNVVYEALSKFKNYTPGAVVAVITERQCPSGEAR